MAAHFLTTSHDKNDIARSLLVADLIAAHRQAYAAWIKARDNIHRAHEVFDPEHHLEDKAAIEAALRATYGGQGDDAILYYTDMTAAADQAFWSEDRAWSRVAAMPLTTPADVKTWLAYVVRHAAKEDEAVTLRRPLEHVAGQLVERLM